jgi:hypothetical protein
MARVKPSSVAQEPLVVVTHVPQRFPRGEVQELVPVHLDEAQYRGKSVPSFRKMQPSHR